MPTPPFLTTLLFTATSALAATAESSAPNWPQFRGANAAGVDAAARPPVKFGPSEGVLWKIEVPWSPSSPIVWGDRIFLTTFSDGQLVTRCHGRADGRLRWTRGDRPKTLHQADFGERILATPVLVRDKLYLRTATHLWAFGT